jgi:hypothetical protein
MDYIDYWKKWLSLCIGEIIKENVEREARYGQKSNTFGENYQYYTRSYGDFVMNN